MKRRLTSFTLSLLLVVSFLSPVTPQGLPPCQNPGTLPATYAWPQNAVIAVHGGGIPAEFHPCIQRVLQNYNQQSDGGNNSGVTFDFYGDSNPPMEVDGSGTVTGGLYYAINLRYGTPPGGALHGSTGGQVYNGRRMNAVVTVSNGITNCEAFAQTLAHEIGHTLGLDDCTACTVVKSSVMVGAPALNDTTHGLEGPTACDNNTMGVHYTGNRCQAEVRDGCLGQGYGWSWNLCACSGLPTDPAPFGDPHQRNCWSLTSFEQFRVGFCTYYLRNVEVVCGGTSFGTQSYVEDIICEEVGAAPKRKGETFGSE